MLPKGKVISMDVGDETMTWCWMDIDPVEKNLIHPVSRYQFGVDLIRIH